MTFSIGRATTLLVAVGVLVSGLALLPAPARAGDVFDDAAPDNVFHDDITWLAGAGVTKGGAPPGNTLFCRDDVVTRGQMAAFLHRALGHRPFVRTYLSDLSPVDDNETVYTGAADVDGDTFTGSVWWFQDSNDSPRWFEYNLSRDYDRLCAVVGTRDDSDAGATYDVEVLLDGNSLFTGNIGLGLVVTIDHAITDGLRLKLESKVTAPTFEQGRVVWADAYLSTGSCS